jgi:hypothetical protein
MIITKDDNSYDGVSSLVRSIQWSEISANGREQRHKQTGYAMLYRQGSKNNLIQ